MNQDNEKPKVFSDNGEKIDINEFGGVVCDPVCLVCSNVQEMSDEVIDKIAKRVVELINDR